MRNKKDLMSGCVKDVVSSKIVGVNTLKIHYADGTSAIRLHDTDIIVYNGDDVILYSGGWKTPTTKERIASFAHVYIKQVKGLWYVGDSLFYDGMVFRDGILMSGVVVEDVKASASIRKSIREYVSLITPDNLPIPSNGDCFYCSMKDEKGAVWGDLSKSDHLELHLEEKYLHGSILVNAMRESGYRDMQIAVHYDMKMADTFKRVTRKYLTKRLLK